MLTITLRKLINSYTNVNIWTENNGVYEPEQYNSGFELFDNVDKYPLIFDNTYTIGGKAVNLIFNDAIYTDNTYRDKLNKKIIDHYINYHIGVKSPYLFKHNFNTKLREIMPKYNAEYRLQWEYFLNSLPKGYFEHEEFNGGSKNNYNSDVTNKKGTIDNFDWSGGISGNNANDPTIDRTYNFDTPQNISSLDTNSPDHMSNATVSNTHSGETYYQNGRVIINGQIPQIQDGNESYPTSKTMFADDKIINGGYDLTEFVNRYNEKYGYNINDVKGIYEFTEEINNIDLKIIKELRDQFLLVY